MKIEEIQKIIDDVSAQIVTLREVIDDYNACKNEKSKMFLLAALNKMVSTVMPTQTSTK